MSDFLTQLGWDAFFEQHFEPFRQKGLEPGRVAVESKGHYLVFTEKGEFTAEVPGRLIHRAKSRADYPKVGDWVALDILENEKKAVIREILPRKTKFSRKVKGEAVDEQVIATNIDVVFVVQGLDQDFNPRRLERYLVLVLESEAQPVVVLNKTDLCAAWPERVEQAKQAAPGEPVLAVSAVTGFGLDKLKAWIKPGETCAFIGSSGVGKTTLINKILGADLLKTGEVRAKDRKGRHVTTRRELVVLPDGGCVIDTPGMRELQLWSVEEGLHEAFPDIEALAQNCHFSDCSHRHEIKCAVREAVERGEISQERYHSFLKLQDELAELERKRRALFDKKESHKPPFRKRRKGRK